MTIPEIVGYIQGVKQRAKTCDSDGHIVILEECWINKNKKKDVDLSYVAFSRIRKKVHLNQGKVSIWLLIYLKLHAR